jgi:hypothetical protein
MRLKVELNEEAVRRLIELAARERRTVPLQAEVIILERLGLWPPEQEEEARQRQREAGRPEGGETHA